MTTTRIPRAGDLVWVDFDPVRGSEQAGPRPALVISEVEFQEQTRRAIVCPITTNTTPWTTKVPLPPGLPVRGAVLVDQVRAVDRASRGFRFIAAAPPEVLWEVRGRLGRFLALEPGPPP